MTTEATALAWQIVAYDARLAEAVRRGELAEVELVQELREQAGMALFRTARKEWSPALRPKHPEQAA